MREWAVKRLVRAPVRSVQPYQFPPSTAVQAKLDANECPFPLPDGLTTELAEQLARVPLHRYPDGRASALRELLSRELPCRATQLFFGNGSDEIIGLLAAAFSEPRSGQRVGRVLYPGPTFVVYRNAALAAGLEPVEVPLNEDFSLDLDLFDRGLRQALPNLVFLARPNNPTGTLWPRQAVLRALEAHPRALVVVDEAYVDYSRDSVIDLVPEHPNLVVLRTLSKIGLAGLRLGYAIAHEAVVEELERVRMPYNVSALTQAAALWLLSQHAGLLRDWVSAIVRERIRLFALLKDQPEVTAYPSAGNMLLIRLGEAGDGRASQVWRTLVGRGVLVRNFDRPGALAGCLRVTVGTRAENDLFVSALADALATDWGHQAVAVL